MEHNGQRYGCNLGNIVALIGWLQPALDRGGNTHTFGDVMAEVFRGDMQLWLGSKGAAVTQINTYPRKRTIHWIWAGGELNQVLDFQDSIRAFGKAHGCTGMSLGGRSGWQRVLAQHGWTSSGVIMEAAL